MFEAPEPSQSALPLGSIRAVVLDTETTGLSTETDRIVQIGAVRLTAGKIDGDGVVDALVNPGVPIPPEATAIHGIDDADVADADRFAEAMPAFAAWVGRSVVIGYAIGFDIAVLQAECRRAGILWKPPRSLDVAHLVQLAAPALPSADLEAAAAWLGIEVRDRHQALGDARLTADIFLALLPKLRAKGVTTLAEAERACLGLTSRLQEEVEAGWQTGSTADAGEPRESIGRSTIDSFPYRFRLRDIMASPPAIVPSDITVETALARMMADKISSIFMAPERERADYGILTERDVLRAIDRRGPEALNETAGSLATRPLISLDQEAFVHRAISLMRSSAFRHLGVTDARGELVGAISARDLLKQRAENAITLGDTIAAAGSAAELGRIWSGLSAVAGTLAQEQIDARNIASIISAELRALTKRACEIAEREFLESGKGAPPVPYAMLVLGSGGRGESLLAMDQDNAIVYGEGDPGGSVDRWFEAFGQRVATILNEAGVAYCQGGVMASHAAWRMDKAHWRTTIAAWLKANVPENILSADIFFDGRPVHGELALGDDLMRDACAAAGKAPAFLSALARQAADIDPPFGWFGRFKLEDGRVDLKKSGLMALFSTARVLALKSGIGERSTRRRLLAARDELEGHDETIGNLVEAHRIILDAILRQQLRDLDRGLPLGNSIRPSELSSLQRENVRWALGRIPLTANLLGTPLDF